MTDKIYLEKLAVDSIEDITRYIKNVTLRTQNLYICMLYLCIGI